MGINDDFLEIVAVNSLKNKVIEIYENGDMPDPSPVETWKKYGYHDLVEAFEMAKK